MPAYVGSYLFHSERWHHAISSCWHFISLDRTLQNSRGQPLGVWSAVWYPGQSEGIATDGSVWHGPRGRVSDDCIDENAVRCSWSKPCSRSWWSCCDRPGVRNHADCPAQKRLHHPAVRALIAVGSQQPQCDVLNRRYGLAEKSLQTQERRSGEPSAGPRTPTEQAEGAQNPWRGRALPWAPCRCLKTRWFSRSEDLEQALLSFIALCGHQPPIGTQEQDADAPHRALVSPGVTRTRVGFTTIPMMVRDANAVQHPSVAILRALLLRATRVGYASFPSEFRRATAAFLACRVLYAKGAAAGADCPVVCWRAGACPRPVNVHD